MTQIQNLIDKFEKHSHDITYAETIKLMQYVVFILLTKRHISGSRV